MLKDLRGICLINNQKRNPGNFGKEEAWVGPG